MCWKKDFFLQGLVHEAQTYARRYQWFQPDQIAGALTNTVNDVLEFLSKEKNPETSTNVISSLIIQQEGQVEGKDLLQEVEMVKKQIKQGIAWFAKHLADSGEVFEDDLLADPEAFVEWVNQPQVDLLELPKPRN